MHFIRGEFTGGTPVGQIDVVDPATRTVIGTVPDAEPGRRGQRRRAPRGTRSRAPGAARRRGTGAASLAALAAALRDHAETFAELETRNSGKPIVEAESDIEDAATCFEYYAGLATKIHGDVVPVPDDALVLALREPVGVAAQIIPWNYPLLMAAWKLAPALCAGCTVVLKPAEETPLSVLELAKQLR